jgi:Ca-activated chloride channel family protein
VRLSLAVDILPCGIPMYDFRSSLHAVIDGETRQGIRRITLHAGERLDRDFILRFRLGEKGVQKSLSLKPDAAGGPEGTFLLTVVPPPGPDPLTQPSPPVGRGLGEGGGGPRDVAFVLDRSGSMEGWKMVAARRALARMVDTLTARDRFTVFAFDNAVETPPAFAGQGLVPATDRNRFRAVEFLAAVGARGGTDMAPSLDRAVTELNGGACGTAGTAVAHRDRVLVLVTDGQVGNEDQILRHLGARLGGIRIFTLGIDQAVNEGFLRRLAGLGGGACEVVESEDRLDEVMAQVHRRIGTPLLTGLRLEPAGIQIVPGTLVPGRLPDLFAGAPLVVLGRYTVGQVGNLPKGGKLPTCPTDGGGSLRLVAHDEAGQPWSETVPAAVSANEAIPAVWARGHIRELEDRFVIGREDRATLEKRIVTTSLKYGVLCRFTALVAVDRAEAVNEGGRVHRVTQAVEAPAGWAGAAESHPMPACAPAPAWPGGAIWAGAVPKAGGVYREVQPPERAPDDGFDPCYMATPRSGPPTPQERQIADILLAAREEQREVNAEERERLRALLAPAAPADEDRPASPALDRKRSVGHGLAESIQDPTLAESIQDPTLAWQAPLSRQPGSSRSLRGGLMKLLLLLLALLVLGVAAWWVLM